MSPDFYVGNRSSLAGTLKADVTLLSAHDAMQLKADQSIFRQDANFLYLTGIDEALLVDEQLLPRITGADSAKIATPFGGVDFGIPTPRFMTFDQSVFGAGILVGLDPRYAIQRFVNISASYDAIEKYVMRKATGFRVDHGEMATRLHDEAWSVLSLSV